MGFNHNVVYKGEVFHVQTEDSGVKNPHIITLLYRGGVILCSKKTSYADILMMEKLESVVEELMKDQHKDMMRRLKSGEFDERAFSIEAKLPGKHEISSPEPSAETAPAPEPVSKPKRIDDILSSTSCSPGVSSRSVHSMSFEMPVQKAVPATPAAPQPAEKPAKDFAGLDNAFPNSFGANEKK
jgi:hypothetical protein